MKRLFLDDGRIKYFNLTNGTFIKNFINIIKMLLIFVIKLNMFVSISS